MLSKTTALMAAQDESSSQRQLSTHNRSFSRFGQFTKSGLSANPYFQIKAD
jgi:hypothetical protein